jgi:hypothetical protein
MLFSLGLFIVGNFSEKGRSSMVFISILMLILTGTWQVVDSYMNNQKTDGKI